MKSAAVKMAVKQLADRLMSNHAEEEQGDLASILASIQFNASTPKD